MLFSAYISFVERSMTGQMRAMQIYCEMQWMHGKIIYRMSSWTITDSFKRDGV
jgi:hypothetical protein